MNIVEIAKEYAFRKHREVNQKYDDKCYTYHLQCVYSIAKEYIHLIPEKDRDDVLASAFLHDVIEDARENYNDALTLVEETSKVVSNKELLIKYTNLLNDVKQSIELYGDGGFGRPSGLYGRAKVLEMIINDLEIK